MKYLKPTIIFALTSFLIILFTSSASIKNENYKELWNKVEKFEKEGLPKSALDVVNKIYDLAQSSNNSPQIIKAIIHKLKYKEEIQDDAFIELIENIDEQIEKSRFPTTNLLYYIKASLFRQYFYSNHWQIMENHETTDARLNDIKKWNANKFLEIITQYYLLSIENEEQLKKNPVTDFEAILVKGNTNEIRPTLYDFLVYDIIDYFSNKDISVAKARDEFILNDEKYFAPAIEFAALNFISKDTLSVHFNAIKLYQKLLQFRLKDGNKKALLFADYERLKFIYKNAILPEKDEKYIINLQKLIEDNKDVEESSHLYYEIAQIYRTKANSYNFENEILHQYRWNNIKALAYINKAKENYPKAEGTKQCMNLETEIKRPDLAFSSEQAYIPGTSFPIQIRFKNLNEASLHIYKTNMQKVKSQERVYNSKNWLQNIINSAEKISSANINLPNPEDFQMHSFNYIQEPLKKGVYLFVLTDNKEFKPDNKLLAFEIVHITDLSYVSKPLGNGDQEVLVIHRNSGKPIENAQVNSFISEYNYKQRSTISTFLRQDKTDKNGKVIIPYDESLRNKKITFQIINNSDTLISDVAFYIYKKQQETTENPQTYFFTDRAIYRPGQLVYFKGIILDNQSKKSQLLTGLKTKIQVFDPNYQPFYETELTTNAYGSFHGSFVLPKGKLNGSFNIKNESGSTQIKVEEYKRPKFYVEFKKCEDQLVLDQDISISGSAKSYAGSAIQNAKVKYHIIRKPVYRPWFYHFNSPETEISNGDITTDENGNFELNFIASPDLSIPKSKDVQFNFEITVNITDINGETQSKSQLLKIGYYGFEITTDIKDIEEKNAFNTINLSIKNAQNIEIPAKGKTKIQKIKSPEKTFIDYYWSYADTSIYTSNEWNSKITYYSYDNEYEFSTMEIEKTILEEEFNTEKTSIISLKNKPQPGIYLLNVTSTDKFGSEITFKKYFTVFDKKSKKLPYLKLDWVQINKKEFQPGDKLQITLGSSEDLRYLIQITKKDEILTEEIIELNNEQKLFEIPIKDEYRGNFNLHITAIKRNRFFQHAENISVPFDNKKLNTEITTFRSILQPGEKEEWTIKVKDAENNPVASEILLSLYDKSLDQFIEHNWHFNYLRYDYQSYNYRADFFRYNNARTYTNLHTKYHKINTNTFDQFNWFGFSIGRNKYGPVYRSSPKDESMVLYSVIEDDKEIADTESQNLEEVAVANETPKTSETPQKPFKLRTNFNETAFFYPELRTDENGSAIVKFAIPETVTTWKLQGAVHSKDLKFEVFEKEIITQKKLMVFPNLPRFVRENDTIIISTKISNLTENELNGKTFIEISDVISDEIIYPQSENSFGFNCNANSSNNVEWEIYIPKGIEIVKIKIVAEAQNHSDGEVHLIPVLPSKILITETLPLALRPNQEKEYKLKHLLYAKEATENFNYTLEYTSNPIWYALQALRFIHDNSNENSEAIFSRLYFNLIAQHIIDNHPEIQKVFEIVKVSDSKEAFSSKLEKNQDLKTTILEATPWLIDAMNETESMLRIAQLFENDYLIYDTKHTVQKLKELQLSNGSWPWFKGMHESRYITQHIVAGFGHLAQLSILDYSTNREINNMIKSAIEFLDNEIIDDYNNLIAIKNIDLEKDHISYFQIHYLYTRSFFREVPISEELNESFNYYLGQAKKYWIKKGKYQQGQIALATLRFENKDVTQKIIKSLKEFALYSDELGMYWKENYNSPYWHNAPIEMHALMIELFNELGYKNDVNELKIWLLKQKQTNHWPTTKSTAHAIYVLLLNKESVIIEPTIEISIGKENINLRNERLEAGTGYFKKNWSENDISNEMGIIKVTGNTEEISWGAIYWQYFEEIENVVGNETSLSVEKNMYKNSMTENGILLVPIDESELNLGDIITIQLKVKTDRDLEFVHLRDMRASGFEPMNTLSGYNFKNGIGFYQSTKDVTQNFFFDKLPKGVYFFEYKEVVSNKGNYNSGIATVQCMYAPEFSSNSKSFKIDVK